jgi:hypothetical protein
MERTIRLPDSMIADLEKYTQYRHKSSLDDAIVELLHYALTSVPPYFEQFDWERAEAEADEEIRTGRVQTCGSERWCILWNWKMMWSLT